MIEGLKLEFSGADITQADADGTTSMLYACREGHLDVIRVLLEANAPLIRYNKFNTTALMSYRPLL